MARRRGGGHPNGYCQNCGKPATSLEADFCSKQCRYEAQKQQAKAAHYREMYEEQMEEDDE